MVYKVSDFVWGIFETYAEERKTRGNGYIAVEEIEGKTRERMNPEKFVRDTIPDVEASERECMGVYSRNTKELKAAFDAGDRAKFDEIVCADLAKTDEYRNKRTEEEWAEKEEQGEIDPGFTV